MHLAQGHNGIRPPDSSLLQKYQAAGLLGRSKSFIQLLHGVEAAADSDVRVLLEGQSGTGKELIARAIHRFSARSAQPFVAIDCGAIQENLIESELFGHVRGAFTGAATGRKGLFEAAHPGTLFIDEVTNLPLEMQAKLMRVLQEGEIRPVGSNETHRVDVRVIAASSNSLRERVEDGLFRQDLYFRLHVYPIYLPTLAERTEDVTVLASCFLERFATEQEKQVHACSEEIMEFIAQRSWPGNIRELENFIERMVTLIPADEKTLTPEFLPPDLLEEFLAGREGAWAGLPVESLEDKVGQVEKDLIAEALRKTNWNKSQAARMLRIPTPTLRYKIRKYGIERNVNQP